jgi:hypothetical protein
MKSKKRHEMETNELAASLMRLYEQAQTHQRAILGVAIVVVVILGLIVVYPMVRSSKQGSVQAAFATAEGSVDADAVRDFIAKYPDAPQAPLARLTLADRLLAEVVRGLKVATGEDPKAKAARFLAEAKDLYNEAAAKSPTLAPVAKVGLALIDIQEGGIDKGTAELQEVVAKWPDSLASAMAKTHLEALAGYKPVPFSNEPLEETKEPAAKSGEPKEGQIKTPPAKAPEMTGPEPKAKEKKPDTPPPAKPKG